MEKALKYPIGIQTFSEIIEKGYVMVSEEEAYLMLKDNYDGYHFSEECPDIYNPYSLLNALDSRKIGDNRFRSGTPSYLIGVLKRADFYLPDLDCIETLPSGLSVNESYLNNPVSLLFESGYLTIKDYDDEKELYTLGLPNREVAKSFYSALMPRQQFLLSLWKISVTSDRYHDRQSIQKIYL